MEKMFNCNQSDRNIVVVGAANSGKTVFFTSLFWHLFEGMPGKFIPNVRFATNDFSCFRNGINTMDQLSRWPEKVIRYYPTVIIASGLGNGQDIIRSFENYPLERIWDRLPFDEKPDYCSWVHYYLEEYVSPDPVIKEEMKHYWEMAYNPETPFECLCKTYKKAMCALLDKDCRIIPSLYYLDDEGSMLGDRNNQDREKAIQNRPVCGLSHLTQQIHGIDLVPNHGDLLPIPDCWLRAKHCQEYHLLEKLFEFYWFWISEYFNEGENNDFIFLIDIPGILKSGRGRLRRLRQDFREFIHLFLSNRFSHQKDMKKSAPYHPKIAFVATKADLVASSHRDRLEGLLREFVDSVLPPGIPYQTFICSACVSAEERKNQNGETILIGQDPENPEKTIEFYGKLPEHWPDKWDSSEYNFPLIAPKIPALKPPEQLNLDRILEFMLSS